MLEVNLFTSQGEFVVTVIIPDYNPRPQAILWGDRLFGFELDDELEPRYSEIFWVAATDERNAVKIANLTRFDKPKMLKAEREFDKRLEKSGFYKPFPSRNHRDNRQETSDTSSGND